MSKALARIMNRYGSVYSGLVRRLEGMTDEQLKELLHASTSMSQTNCWWATYRAAQIMTPMILEEIRTRELKATVIAKSQEPTP